MITKFLRALSLALLLSASFSARAGSGFAEVDRLAGEQKLQAALEKTKELLEGARKQGDDRAFTEALIKATQLEMALHGYESAVRLLKETPWPKGPAEKVLLNLYYARALFTYQQSYGWEIGQREETVSGSAIDLKAWTTKQIGREIGRALDEAMQEGPWLNQPAPAFFRPYLTANNYPSGVRPWLRDALTYLAVDHLANQQFWTAQEANEIYKLDAAKLATNPPAQRLPAASWESHPLERLASWLRALEVAHRTQPDAALEARYALFQALHTAFPESRDQSLIRERLAAFQKSAPRSPWWARGQALLAEFYRADERPGAWIEARREAIAGRDAYPGSPGAQMCVAILFELERAEMGLTAMAADAPGKRSLLLEYRNARKAYFRAYRVDAEEALRSVRGNGPFSIDRNEVRKLFKDRKPEAAWTADLAETQDFRSHRHFVTAPELPIGAYQIFASFREDFSEQDNLVQGAPMLITGIVLSSLPLSNGTIEARVLDGASGKPLAGVKVTLYRFDWQNPPVEAFTGTSGAEGIVNVPGDQPGGNHFLVARKDSQLAYASNIYFSRSGPVPSVRSAFLFTDRSVYRPQQKILFKVVGYSGTSTDGRYNVAKAGETLEVRLLDPNHHVVGKQTVKLGAFGSAAGEFSVPTGRPLGEWTLQSSLPGPLAAVKVEEYKRPSFEATLVEAKEPLRLNRKARIQGEARYYFGLPLTAGKARWRVTRTEISPWWWEFWGWWRGGRKAPQTIAAGTAEIGADGSFAFDFLPEADERKAGGKDQGLTYNFEVAVDLTDEGGETRSASRAFRLGFVAVEAKLAWEEGFFRAGKAAVLRASLADLDGKPLRGSGEFRLARLQAPETVLPSELPADRAEPTPYDLPGDSRRARWETGFRWETITRSWKEEGVLLEGKVEHDEKGEGKIRVPRFEKGGVYRLTYRTKDSFGASFEVTRDLLVAGERLEGLSLPLVAVAEFPSRKVGETARFLIHSGLKDQPLSVELYHGGKRMPRKLTAGIVELPVTFATRGGFTLSVSGLRDYQGIVAEVSENVPWSDRELKVEFTTFRDKLRPGQKETLRISVKSDGGNALSRGGAELLAYMYDRSLDLFAPHRVPPVFSIYSTGVGAVSRAYSLGTAPGWAVISSMPVHPGSPTFTADHLDVYPSYGIGGPGRRGRFYGMPGAMVMESAQMDSAPMAASMAAPREGLQMAKNAMAKKEVQAAGAAAASATPEAARSNFSETAFFAPHLVLGTGGTAAVEFTAPDSVTSWRVLAHALTKDLRYGSAMREARTVKELMVRPYAPRFLREGDEAEIRVQVNNAGESVLSGELEFGIVDNATGQSVLADFALKGEAKKNFRVEKNGSVTLSFSVRAPKRVGDYAFQVTARAGAFSDGERRPFPVLPSRLHLAQSRFVALQGKSEKTLGFQDLAQGNDPTRQHEQLVVTVDAQLFYGLLQALPYLVKYPYECVEQTMNRFLSTGIVTSLFAKYPAVERMAKEFSSRKARLERFDDPDPNQRMQLEESPWLQESQGGKTSEDPVLNVLDSSVAKAEREDALAKLRKMQLANGAFPWFQGGPPDQHMTLYILLGLSRALEFQVELPKEPVVKAWGYVRSWLDENLARMMSSDYGWETVTLVNFALSAYPDASWTGSAFDEAYRRKLLDFSFSRWKEHAPLVKGYLALTLHRMNREKDARLVWASVMDSAKHDEQLGTYWAREDRSWLWYNDVIETHAFALRTQMELARDDKHNEGIVQWLFLNKKLNHWKSTRATAEVLYALTHYLDRTKQLGGKEDVKLELGNQTHEFRFDPDRYTGRKNQIVVPGPKVDPKAMSKIRVSKASPGFAFASATWHFSTEKLPDEDRGDFFEVSRKYFRREQAGTDWRLVPLAEGAKIAVGDQLEVHLSLRTKHEAEYVHLRDPRGAGFEPENVNSGWRWNLGISWYEETRDSGANFFFSRLPVGEYTFQYRVRANMAGTFRVGPATVQSLYAPEFNAYSAGSVVAVEAKGP